MTVNRPTKLAEDLKTLVSYAVMYRHPSRLNPKKVGKLIHGMNQSTNLEMTDLVDKIQQMVGDIELILVDHRNGHQDEDHLAAYYNEFKMQIRAFLEHVK